MRRPERIERKTGHRYQVRFRGPDGRVKYKCFRTEREALRFSRAIEDRKDKGQPMDFEKTFTELAAEFRTAHIAHSLRPSSKKDALRILARLERRFGPQKLTAIHAPDLERFRDEELAALRAGRQTALAARVRALRLALGGGSSGGLPRPHPSHPRAIRSRRPDDRGSRHPRDQQVHRARPPGVRVCGRSALCRLQPRRALPSD